MIAGILLAAGKSERMKSPKPFFLLNGETFYEYVLQNYIKLNISPIVIVINPAHIQLWEKARGKFPDIIFRENPDPSRGQLSSLKEALIILREQKNITGAILALIDHPQVPLNIYQSLIQNHLVLPQKIIIPTYNNMKGHPVLIPENFFNEILNYEGSQGLKGFFQSNSDNIFYFVTQHSEVLQDIDTPEDFNNTGTGEFLN